MECLWLIKEVLKLIRENFLVVFTQQYLQLLSSVSNHDTCKDQTEGHSKQWAKWHLSSSIQSARVALTKLVNIAAQTLTARASVISPASILFSVYVIFHVLSHQQCN